MGSEGVWHLQTGKKLLANVSMEIQSFYQVLKVCEAEETVLCLFISQLDS